uniref:PABS domain-containing protein n=1 Tax=Cucumis sativus TaxID=3659 RepID=A0A0A0K7K7_CUCSA
MAYALAPVINIRPWSFGFVTTASSIRYLSRSLNLSTFRRYVPYSSVGKLTKATGDASFRRVEDEDEEEEVFQVLTAVTSDYNDIVIVDTPKSRMLLLDSSYNVHSILYKEQMWTGSYWDEFASLPAIIPEGPIAILGLGGGTTAHLMLASWPSLQLEGWEIDGILIDKARNFLGLSDLEKHSADGGILNIHIGDALDPSVRISGGYAGIVIDLFSNGKVLPQLQQVGLWLDLKDRLMVGGRIMINCGGNVVHVTENGMCSEVSSTDCFLPHISVIEALSEVFPKQVCHDIKLYLEKAELLCTSSSCEN